jgi:hypothetical protein
VSALKSLAESRKAMRLYSGIWPDSVDMGIEAIEELADETYTACGGLGSNCGFMTKTEWREHCVRAAWRGELTVFGMKIGLKTPTGSAGSCPAPPYAKTPAASALCSAVGRAAKDWPKFPPQGDGATTFPPNCT